MTFIIKAQQPIAMAAKNKADHKKHHSATPENTAKTSYVKQRLFARFCLLNLKMTFSFNCQFVQAFLTECQ